MPFPIPEGYEMESVEFILRKRSETSSRKKVTPEQLEKQAKVKMEHARLFADVRDLVAANEQTIVNARSRQLSDIVDTGDINTKTKAELAGRIRRLHLSEEYFTEQLARGLMQSNVWSDEWREFRYDIAHNLYHFFTETPRKEPKKRQRVRR